jgi:hypothetical protein
MNAIVLMMPAAFARFGANWVISFMVPGGLVHEKY